VLDLTQVSEDVRFNLSMGGKISKFPINSSASVEEMTEILEEIFSNTCEYQQLLGMRHV